MSATRPFSHPIKVVPEDIDFMGHVNNARYLNWVQDAVLAHWNKLAPADEVASKAWVALKHEITYRKPAFLEDEGNQQIAAGEGGTCICGLRIRSTRHSMFAALFSSPWMRLSSPTNTQGSSSLRLLYCLRRTQARMSLTRIVDIQRCVSWVVTFALSSVHSSVSIGPIRSTIFVSSRRE